MGKVLFTLVSAALVGTCLFSGTAIQQALAQTEASGALESAAALEEQALAACANGEAEFRSALDSYSALMAELVGREALPNQEALTRFQALRDATREVGCGAFADAMFEELFPDTAATADPGIAGPTIIGGPVLGSDAVSSSPS